MFRLLRLLKLDKYFPSISLIDDVLRLKKDALIISSFAAGTMWILFAGAMYLAEYKDHSMEIDNLPLYNCTDECTMSDRFRNFFVSMSYTGIHLTGDFPAVEYDGYGRIICFFIVIAAVGVVSVPSGLIASGFTEIVESKNSDKNSEFDNAGDDWYEVKYRELEGVSPPPSQFGELVDYIQTTAHDFLNGVEDETTKVVKRTLFSSICRKIFFGLIIANVIAVIAESIPEIDRAVGNQQGNFFDVFEKYSVIVFTMGTFCVTYCNNYAMFITFIALTSVSNGLNISRIHSSSHLRTKKSHCFVLFMGLCNDFLWYGRLYLRCALVHSTGTAQHKNDQRK